MKVYEQLANDFVAEGVEVVFGLMGDGNMTWMCAMAERPGVRVVHARHESAALAMADGWARSAGRVGVASVTCGPGLTQLGTSLTVAARHGTPLVVLAGDTPTGGRYHLQRFNAAPFVVSTGAECLQISTQEELATAAGRAFALAISRSTPVVVSVPYDLQNADRPPSAVAPPCSRQLLGGFSTPEPSEAEVAGLAELLKTARNPVILAGRGAVRSGCRDDLLRLADRLGAGIGTTVRAKGWFDDTPHDLGIIGGLSTEPTRTALAAADLVLAVGASLSPETSGHGALSAEAQVICIDPGPELFLDGRRTADRYVRADAAATIRYLTAQLGCGEQTVRSSQPTRGDITVDIAVDTESDPAAGALLDPADTIAALDALLPRDWSLAIGAGHFWNWLVTGLHGRQPHCYQFFYDFGAIAQAMSGAIGMTYAAAGRPVVAIEGDGSVLMNIQEFETMGRHHVPLLVLVINDGAYGAEYHKLLAAGVDPRHSRFGWPDLAGIARSFGLRGHRPTSCAELAVAIHEYERYPAPTVIDLRVDVRLPSQQYQRLYYNQSGSSPAITANACQEEKGSSV